MPVKSLFRTSGTTYPPMKNRPNANDCRVDSADEKLKFIDGTGAVRAVVTEDQAQTLTNKTLTSPVTTGGTSTTKRVVTTTAVDGAIAIASGVVRLTKGSAAAMTLAAPSAAQEGTIITITAGSAFAHVVTATGLIEDGVTGGAKNTWTSAAFVGSSITLVAINLEWYVESKNLGTVA